MPRNGSGVYSVYTPGNPVVAGTTIDPTAFNNTTNDLATALTNSLASNGETPVTANLQMSGFKHTGAGAATVAGQYMTYGQAGNFTNIVAAGTVTGVTDLTTTGNTILGDAAADTLNVGNGGLIKDTNGNTGVGISPTTKLSVGGATSGTSALVDVIYNASQGTSAQLRYVFNHSGSNFWGLGSGGSAGTFIIGQAAAATGGSPTALLTMTTAGDVTALGVAVSRSKAATTSRASTTTLADDPDLIVPLGIGRFAVQIWVPIGATTSGGCGIKGSIAFSGTATGSFSWASDQQTALSSGGLVAIGGAGMSIATINNSISNYLLLTGYLSVTVAGNASFQWAQASSTVNNLNVGVGGWMNCTKVA